MIAGIGLVPHPGDGSAVTKAHDPLVFHGDGAAEAFNPSDEVGASVGGMHDVGHLYRARLGFVRGLQHDGAFDVTAGGGGVVARPDQPSPVLWFA